MQQQISEISARIEASQCGCDGVSIVKNSDGTFTIKDKNGTAVTVDDGTELMKLKQQVVALAKKTQGQEDLQEQISDLAAKLQAINTCNCDPIRLTKNSDGTCTIRQGDVTLAIADNTAGILPKLAEISQKLTEWEQLVHELQTRKLFYDVGIAEHIAELTKELMK